MNTKERNYFLAIHLLAADLCLWAVFLHGRWEKRPDAAWSVLIAAAVVFLAHVIPTYLMLKDFMSEDK